MNFHELNDKLRSFEKARDAYLQRCQSLAYDAGLKLIEIVQAPDEYEYPSGRGPGHSKYFQVRAIGETGALTVVSRIEEALNFHDDGSFEFGLCLCLEKSPTTSSKYPVGTKITCRISSESIWVKISEAEMTFPPDGDEDAKLFVAKNVVKEISSYLDKRFDDMIVAKKVGF